jgi:hypothetical protein
MSVPRDSKDMPPQPKSKTGFHDFVSKVLQNKSSQVISESGHKKTTHVRDLKSNLKKVSTALQMINECSLKQQATQTAQVRDDESTVVVINLDNHSGEAYIKGYTTQEKVQTDLASRYDDR